MCFEEKYSVVGPPQKPAFSLNKRHLFPIAGLDKSAGLAGPLCELLGLEADLAKFARARRAVGVSGSAPFQQVGFPPSPRR